MAALFLDDIRKPKDVTWINLPNIPWNIARTYVDFVTLIDLYIPHIVSFDHDLGMELLPEPNYYSHFDGEITRTFQYREYTGYDCACYLVDKCNQHNIPFPEYYIHSSNPVGAERIKSYIESAKRSGYIL